MWVLKPSYHLFNVISGRVIAFNCDFFLNIYYIVFTLNPIILYKAKTSWKLPKCWPYIILTYIQICRDVLNNIFSTCRCFYVSFRSIFIMCYWYTIVYLGSMYKGVSLYLAAFYNIYNIVLSLNNRDVKFFFTPDTVHLYCEWAPFTFKYFARQLQVFISFYRILYIIILLVLVLRVGVLFNSVIFVR